MGDVILVWEKFCERVVEKVNNMALSKKNDYVKILV